MDETPYKAPKIREKANQARSIWIVAALILVPFLYVLSIGPYVALEDGLTRQDWPYWAQAFYAPIFWAIDHSESADKFFDWYMFLWLPADDPRRG